MKTYIQALLAALAALLCVGCSHNYYNVPRDTFEKKVRTLGVAHIMLDRDSDIRHPEKEALLTVVEEANRNNEKELVALLREKGGFYLVRPLEDEPASLFTSLLFRRERRDDAGIVYNKYFYKNDALRDLINRNSLDAVMLVVVGGLTRNEKVLSGTLLTSAVGDYNSLIMTAQILDSDGTILWEYPNFRQRVLSYTPLMALQYPDFDEATANVSDVVELHFKTIPGLKRSFGKTVSSSAQKDKEVSVPYALVYKEMLSVLGPEWQLFGKKKEQEKPAPEPAAEPAAKPAPPPAAKPATNPAPSGSSSGTRL